MFWYGEEGIVDIGEEGSDMLGRGELDNTLSLTTERMFSLQSVRFNTWEQDCCWAAH